MRDNLLDYAGSVAFSALLAVFPFLLFAVALASLVIDPATLATLVEEVRRAVPGPAADLDHLPPPGAQRGPLAGAGHRRRRLRGVDGLGRRGGADHRLRRGVRRPRSPPPLEDPRPRRAGHRRGRGLLRRGGRAGAPRAGGRPRPRERARRRPALAALAGVRAPDDRDAGLPLPPTPRRRARVPPRHAGLAGGGGGVDPRLPRLLRVRRPLRPLRGHVRRARRRHRAPGVAVAHGGGRAPGGRGQRGAGDQGVHTSLSTGVL